MPIYTDPRHGISDSEGMLEAAAVAPQGRPMLNTFEFWHPSLAEPIYLVRNKANLVATKEAAAARDAGVDVEYLACAIDSEPAKESDDTPSPDVKLTVGMVSGLVSDALRAARGSLEKWVVIERLYAADDTSGPARLPPTQRFITRVAIGGDSVEMTASYADPANVAVPGTTFKRSEHPGLVR